MGAVVVVRKLVAKWVCVALACGASVASAAQPAANLYELARQAALVGKAQTVLGPVSPDSLGFTLMHEHLFVDFFPEYPSSVKGAEPLFHKMQESGWTIPNTAEEREFFERPQIAIDMVNDLRRGWRSRTNFRIDDERDVLEEVTRYRRVGGRTIVDLTPEGLQRDPKRLRRFASQHSVSIVMGTGWYRWPYHPSSLRELSIEDLTERMVLDIVEGSGEHRVKAGIIGEIPLDSRSLVLAPNSVGTVGNDAIAERIGAAERRLVAVPVTERDRVPVAEIYDARELKVLRAAGNASRLTGAAISLHAREPWLGYLRLLTAEGVDPARIIVGHAHPHFMDRELLVHSLRTGVVLQADYLLQQYATKAPLGELREILDGVAWAITQGYRNQVLLSLDMCNKLGQQRYGGGGYTTLHDYVFPYLRGKGVSEADLRHVMIENPKRLLTFVAPRELH
jgi:phosphotriesterase-related protein